LIWAIVYRFVNIPQAEHLRFMHFTPCRLDFHKVLLILKWDKNTEDYRKQDLRTNSTELGAWPWRSSEKLREPGCAWVLCSAGLHGNAPEQSHSVGPGQVTVPLSTSVSLSING
jgi:hypothetical protein